MYGATIWKFEHKNSQEYHHIVCNGTTNRAVEKGLSQPLLCKLIVMSIPYLSYVKLLKNV